MSETTDKYAAALTDDEIDNAHTDALRDMATDAGLSGYDSHVTVLDVQITPEVFASPGTLTALDKFVTALRAAYVDREPRVEQRYRDTVELKVWQEDDHLRQSIKYARDRASKSE